MAKYTPRFDMLIKYDDTRLFLLFKKTLCVKELTL